MIRKTIISVNKATDPLPLPKIPVPSDKAMELGKAVNFAVGTSLIAFGLLTRHKWLIALGAGSIASNQIVTKKK